MFNDIQGFKNKRKKRLLVIDDNEIERNMIVEALNGNDIELDQAKYAQEAMELIRTNDYDCIILDLVLPDAEGMEIIRELEENKSDVETALIIYSAKDISKKELLKLNKFANQIILKSSHSLDQLVDQAALFLHRVHKEMSQEMSGRIESYYLREDVLNGKTVLIVDDDVRNLFALTTVLERYNITVLSAESGKEAMDILNHTRNIDMVLMDIMMPEMDGYETMKHIRQEPKNKNLTIIAVTAKAMKGDRQKCIESGASDYITKPVNVDQLTALMRVWLK
jgi:CheY-like chemotaxis protein